MHGLETIIRLNREAAERELAEEQRERERVREADRAAEAIRKLPPPIGMHDRLPGGRTPEEWPGQGDN